MDGEEIITLYETVAVITGKMLVAARAGDWDRLSALESQRASHVETLKKSDPPTALSGPVSERKVGIIQKILAVDREIRNLTERWMAHLSALIKSTSTERKLSIAYSGHGTG